MSTQQIPSTPRCDQCGRGRHAPAVPEAPHAPPRLVRQHAERLDEAHSGSEADDSDYETVSFEHRMRQEDVVGGARKRPAAAAPSSPPYIASPKRQRVEAQEVYEVSSGEEEDGGGIVVGTPFTIIDLTHDGDDESMVDAERQRAILHWEHLKVEALMRARLGAAAFEEAGADPGLGGAQKGGAPLKYGGVAAAGGVARVEDEAAAGGVARGVARVEDVAAVGGVARVDDVAAAGGVARVEDVAAAGGVARVEDAGVQVVLGVVGEPAARGPLPAARVEKAAAKDAARVEKAAAKDAARVEKAAAKDAARVEKAAAKDAARVEKAAAKDAAQAARPKVFQEGGADQAQKAAAALKLKVASMLASPAGSLGPVMELPQPLKEFPDTGVVFKLGNAGGEYALMKPAAGTDYYCACPAWKKQPFKSTLRTCKHLIAYLGEAYESARLTNNCIKEKALGGGGRTSLRVMHRIRAMPGGSFPRGAVRANLQIGDLARIAVHGRGWTEHVWILVHGQTVDDTYVGSLYAYPDHIDLLALPFITFKPRHVIKVRKARLV